MQISKGRCRDMPAYIWAYIFSLAVGSLRALRDAEPLGVAPAQFPKLLRRTPDRAEALGALAQFGLCQAMRTATISSSRRRSRRGRGRQATDSTTSSTVLS